jgi:hypothetical protein
MMLWRLYIGRGLRWYGPLHTFTLWPYRREDRGNL